jgi:hypothetical protein
MTIEAKIDNNMANKSSKRDEKTRQVKSDPISSRNIRTDEHVINQKNQTLIQWSKCGDDYISLHAGSNLVDESAITQQIQTLIRLSKAGAT